MVIKHSLKLERILASYSIDNVDSKDFTMLKWESYLDLIVNIKYRFRFRACNDESACSPVYVLCIKPLIMHNL